MMNVHEPPNFGHTVCDALTERLLLSSRIHSGSWRYAPLHDVLRLVNLAAPAR